MIYAVVFSRGGPEVAEGVLRGIVQIKAAAEQSEPYIFPAVPEDLPDAGGIYTLVQGRFLVEMSDGPLVCIQKV